MCIIIYKYSSQQPTSEAPSCVGVASNVVGRRSDEKMQMSHTHTHSNIYMIYYMYTCTHNIHVYEYILQYTIYINTHTTSRRERPTTMPYNARGKGEGAVGVRALLIDFKYLLRLYSDKLFYALYIKKIKIQLYRYITTTTGLFQIVRV